MDLDTKALVARARKTARELREGARDLERAAVECDYETILDLLDEFEANDQPAASGERAA
jgi:hypothetical protein